MSKPTFVAGIAAFSLLASSAGAASVSDLLGGKVALQCYRSGNDVRCRNLATGGDWKVFTRAADTVEGWVGSINRDGAKLTCNDGRRIVVVNLDGTNRELITTWDSTNGYFWRDQSGGDWIVYTGELENKSQSGTTWRVKIDSATNRPIEATREQLAGQQYSCGLGGSGVYLGESYGEAYLYNLNTSTKSCHLNGFQNCVGSTHAGDRPWLMYERDDQHHDLVISEWNESSNTARYIWQYHSSSEVFGLWSCTDPEYCVVGKGSLYLVKLQVDTSGSGDRTGSYQEASLGISSYCGRLWVGDANTVRIVSFTAAPTTITEGDSSTLSWQTSNATSVSINQGIGTVSADGSTDVSPTSTTTYTLTAEGTGGPVTDSVTVTVTATPPPPGPGTGILREVWTGIAGDTVADLTSSSDYPDNPSSSETATSFEGPTDWAEDYGTRFRGYLIVPVSGTYYFWIASDDYSELLLNTSGEDPAGATEIASVSGWTDPHEWDKYSSQKSSGVSLTAGNRYYIEALHKEGGGGDNVCVRWQFPNGAIEEPIPGHRLDPYVENDVRIDSFTASPSAITEGESSTLSWTTTNATSVSVDQGIGGVSVNGSTDVSPTSTTTYTLTAEGTGGPVTRKVTVTVTQPDQVSIDSFTASPGSVISGGTSTLSWATSHATSVSIDQGIGGVSADGSTDVSPSATTTYTLTAEGTGGPVTRTVTVEVTTPPTITLIQPNGGEVWYVGTTRHIRWETDLEDCTILYTVDGGTWNLVEGAGSVDTTSPQWLDYEWTVPDEPSSQCRILIKGYFGECPTTSGVFEIRAVTDSDGDGMDDGWEIATFGDLSHDQTTDTDGDGATDYEEFMAGTDPLSGEGGHAAGVGFGCRPGHVDPTTGRAGAVASSLLSLTTGLLALLIVFVCAPARRPAADRRA